MSDDDFSRAFDNKIKNIKKGGIWNVDMAGLLPLATANCLNVCITIYSSRLNHPLIHICPNMNISEAESNKNDVKFTYLAVNGYEQYDSCGRKKLSNKNVHQGRRRMTYSVLQRSPKQMPIFLP